MACPICGPICSRYYMILSIWAVVMLGFLGIFFWIRSPGLFEDTPAAKLGDDHKPVWEEHGYDMQFVYDKYEQCAINCWIACGLYVVLFFFSFVQFRMNNRSNYEMS